MTFIMPPGIKFNTNLITTIKIPEICHQQPLSDDTQLRKIVKLNVCRSEMTPGDEMYMRMKSKPALYRSCKFDKAFYPADPRLHKGRKVTHSSGPTHCM